MTLVPLHDHLDLMREHLREGQFADVITLGQRVLRHYPKHLETYRLLGEASLETGDLNGAADLFNRVRSADPENIVALVGLSIVHEQRKEVEEAIWHLERAFEIQPANGELRKELLRLYAQQEGTPRERLKLTPGGLARLYARQGLYSQAIQEFRGLLGRDPARTDVQAALAETLYRVGRKQESAEIAQALLEKLPYCLKANLLLGALWAENGVPEAGALLERARSLDPENTVARGLLPDHWDEAPPPMLPAMTEEQATTAPASAPSVPQFDEAGGREVSWLESLIPGTEPAPQAKESSAQPPVAETPTAETTTPPLAAAEPPMSAEPAGIEPEPVVPEWLTATAAEAPAPLEQQAAPSQATIEAAKEEAVTARPAIERKALSPTAAAQAAQAKRLGESKPVRRMQPALPRVGPTIPGALDKLPTWLRGAAASVPPVASSAPAASSEESASAVAARLGALPQAQLEKTQTPPEMTTAETRTPAGSEAQSTDMPEWLTRARQAVRSGQAEESVTASGAPEEKPTGLTEANAEPAPAQEPPASPEWLRADSTAPAAEAPAQAEEALPTWLAESETEEQPDTPASNSALPDWLSARKDAEPPAAPSAASSVPTWLRPSEPETHAKTSAPDAAIPDWLQTFPPSEPQPAPMPTTESPQAQFAPGAEVDETIPEWLREIMEAKEAEPVESAPRGQPPEPAKTQAAAPMEPIPPATAAPVAPAMKEMTPSIEAIAASSAPAEAGPVQAAAPESPLAEARQVWARGNQTAAIELYEKALQSGPGLTLDVIADFERFVQEPDTPMPAHRLLGDAYSMVGRYKEALEQYRIVLGK